MTRPQVRKAHHRIAADLPLPDFSRIAGERRVAP